MVTLVVNMLRVSPGAAATWIGWMFGVFDCGTLTVALVLEAADGAAAAGLLAGPVWDEAAGVLPPPPPQAARAEQTRSRAWSRMASFIACCRSSRMGLVGSGVTADRRL